MDPLSSKRAPVILAQATAPHSPSKTANPGLPGDIPSQWKERVIAVLKDPCFCESVTSVFFELSKSMGIQNLDPDKIKMAFLETTKAVQKKVEWGSPAGLYDPDTGEKANGLFEGYKDKRLDRILLERDLLADYGERPDRDVSTQPRRFIAFLHEAVHKLIKEITWPVKLEKKFEESLVKRILKRHFENPIHQILPFDVSENIATEINEIEVACSSIGQCAKERQHGGMNMAPPLVPPIHNGVDYNGDGILDSYLKADVCTTGETKDGGFYHAYAIEAGPRTPILRGPPPNWVGHDFDEFKECPLAPKQGAKAWSFRFLDRLDPYFTPYARFHNSKRTMSFLPSDNAIIPNREVPQVIQSFVLYVEEQTGKPASPLYAQFEGCQLVELDQLSWATDKQERLDMDQVEALLTSNNLLNVSGAEQKAAQVLKDISATFGIQIAAAKDLPEKEKEEALLKIRDAVVPQLRAVTTGEMKPPKNWENGALVLLGLPMQECLGFPCVLCCKSSENQPVKNNPSVQTILLR